MLQYFVKNFFAPVIIFGYIDAQNQLKVTVASDLLTPIKNADANIQIRRWDSFEHHSNVIINMDMVRTVENERQDSLHVAMMIIIPPTMTKIVEIVFISRSNRYRI